MKHSIYYIAIFLSTVVFSLFTKESRATHAMGGDLSYTCIGQDSILITLNFYRDCAGVSAPTSATVNISSATCGINTTLTLQLVPPAVEVSPLCPSQLPQSTCNNGSLPGVERYIYQGIYVLPQNCPDWVIGYSLCCRNNAINNLQNPGSADFYIQATLNNTVPGGCNSSPQFTSLPVPYICINQPFNYNHGAIDVDGDSLVYTLINPLDSPGAPIAYVSPYSPTYPISTASGTFPFNNNTGQMTFTPNACMTSVVTVLVEEYRNGVLIGSTMRDIQIVVLCTGCNNQQPSISGIMNLQPGPVMVDSFHIALCPEDTADFYLLITDPDPNQVVTASTNLALSIPSATWDTTILSNDSVLFHFYWVPSAYDTGVNVFTVTAQDNGCPILGTQIYSYNIFVYDETYAGPDRFYCPAGGPIPINVVGGNQFVWRWIDTTGQLSSANPFIVSSTNDSSRIEVISPFVPPYYIDLVVTSDLSNSCKNKDTVRVYSVPDFIYSISPSDTICLNQNIPLEVITDPQWAPYTYQWTPPDYLNNSGISNPIATPLLSTTFYVAVTSDTGCTIRDSVHIEVAGQAPALEITGDTAICRGDSTQITVLPITALIDEDFDPMDNANWCVASGTVSNGCGSVSGNAMYFDNAGTRELSTCDLNVAFGGVIRFYLLIAQNSTATCENADPGEEVVLEYSTNGGATWTIIQTYDTDLYPTFTQVTVNIPPAAQTSATRFRWRQLSHSGTGFDNWALDNILIDCSGPQCSNFTYQWIPPIGISDPTIPDPWFFPDSTTTYTVIVAPAGTDCENMISITITVGEPFVVIVSPPDTICKFGFTQLFTTVDSGTGPFTYQWTPALGLSDPTIANPIASPSVTTTYTVGVTAPDGCTEEASTDVIVSGVAPRVVITPDNNNVCPGDTVTLTTSIFPLTCGTSPSGCSPQNPPVPRIFGSATTTQFGTPFQGTSEDARTQILLRASDLQAAGITTGTITRLSLDVGTKNSTQSYQNFTIRMGCTNATALSTSVGWQPTLTTVYGPTQHFTSLGPNFFAFHTPYDWDGVSNLIIEICYDNPSGQAPGGIDELRASTSTYTAVMRNYTNGGAGCNLSPVFTHNMVPNMIFFICPAPPITYTIDWDPVKGLLDTTSINTQAVVNRDITYTLSIDDGNCEGADYVTLTIDSGYYLSVSDTLICSDTAQLHARIFGNPPTTALVCGANGTACAGTVHQDTIGTGTATNSSTTFPAPYGNYWKNGRHQFLYRAADLAAAGMTSGTITELAFFVTQIVGTDTYYDYTINMGCTNISDLSGGWVTGLQNVFTPKTVVLNTGWNVHVFDNTYDWDGVSNLVVEICFDNLSQPSFTNNSLSPYTVKPYTASIWYVSDVTYACNNPTTTSSSNNLPNTRFTICEPPPATTEFTWRPGNSLSDSTIANPIAFPDTTTTYIVSVKYVNGCVHYDTMTVYVQQVNFTAGGDTSMCVGDTVQLFATGGTNYLWTPDYNLSCNTCPNPLAYPDTTTTYNVMVSDSSGCALNFEVTVNVGEENTTISPDTTICYGESVQLIAGGGTSYNWTPATGLSCTICANPVASPVVTTTYQVEITYGSGCMITRDVTITVRGEPVTTTGDAAICEGDTANLLVIGGNQYQWTPAAGLSCTDCASPMAYPDTTTTYAIVASDSGFCPQTLTLTVTVNPRPAVDLGPDTTICYGDSYQLTASGGVQYQWTPSTGLSCDTCASTTASPEASTQYVVSVVNAEGCVAYDTITIDVTRLFVDATAIPDLIFEGESSVLDVVVTGGSGNYAYLWSPFESLDDSSAQSPVATPTTTTTYQVIVMDLSDSCRLSDTVLVTVNTIDDFVVPSAFSPNGDGQNDVLEVLTIGRAEVIDFKIFNRWGELVYQGTGPWDGTYKGEPQPVGTYVYQVVVRLPDKGEVKETNAVSLIR